MTHSQIKISLGNAKLEEAQVEELTLSEGETVKGLIDEMNAHHEEAYSWARVTTEDGEEFFHLQNGDWVWVN